MKNPAFGGVCENRLAANFSKNHTRTPAKNQSFSLKSAASALGGVVTGSQILCPGPGHSPHDRSLCVTLDNSGLPIVHSFCGDDWKACRDHVKARLGMTEHHRVKCKEERTKADAKPKLALELWSKAYPIEQTLGEKYLTETRGIPKNIVDRVSDLRFAPRSIFYIDDKQVEAPTLIVALRDNCTNEIKAIQRIPLTSDGQKLDPPGKRMLGHASGCSIKLTADDEVTQGLAICEGLENGLSLLSAGIAPVWACGSAGAIAKFDLLDGIEALTIYADPDAAGIRAARECAGRWRVAGLDVRILKPKTDADFNDLHRGGKHERRFS